MVSSLYFTIPRTKKNYDSYVRIDPTSLHTVLYRCRVIAVDPGEVYLGMK